MIIIETLKLDNWGDLPENYTGTVEYVFGTTCYYLNGELHREDGPAIIEEDDTLIYYLNGELHREDGPAFIWGDGTVFYYLNGSLHREDGPAIIRTDGTVSYFINGKNITKEWIIENNIPEDWDNSHKILFKLTFG